MCEHTSSYSKKEEDIIWHKNLMLRHHIAKDQKRRKKSKSGRWIKRSENNSKIGLSFFNRLMC